ncbi:replication initiation protein RepC [Mesorhizobium sp. WSM2240]
MLMSARRAEHISSSGGYLRSLTDKAKAGQFSIGPACIVQRAPHINSAGGYLRALTEKARAG